MQLLTFEANDISSALDKVRAKLGEDAMIVRSRTVRKGGLFGLAQRERVEVQAARAYADPQTSKEEIPAQLDRWEGTSQSAQNPLGERLHVLDSKLDALLLGLGAGTMRAPEVAAEKGGVATLEAPMVPSEEALLELAGHLPVCEGVTLTEKPMVVAFIGPTGVGKTTMLLKLAGHFSLKEGRRVTIVTADTFRLGATEQLKAFARIFRIGLRIVLSPEEMAEAVRESDDQDLILIDTPGGSQRDQLHQSQVNAFLQAAEPAETHLVLSATSRPAVLKECIRQFADLQANRICFTKLDEAVCLHEVFSAVLGSGLPIAYLGHGQAIPEDLDVATEEMLAQLMIGTDSSEDN